MYNFVLQILAFSSLGVVVYLLARAIPRVGDEPAAPRGPSIIDRLLKKIPAAKIDEQLNTFSAKSLRKIRLILMKVDNFIIHKLGKITRKSATRNNNDNQVK